jgi:hypothetical protein
VICISLATYKREYINSTSSRSISKFAYLDECPG